MNDDAFGPDGPDTVDFWFDPICGWSWIASRWMLEVARLRPVDIIWHPLGLAVLHEGSPEVSPEWQQLRELSKRFVRVVAAVRERCGAGAVEPFYTALGQRVHGADGLFAPVRAASEETLTEVRIAALGQAGPVIAAALADVGLPDDLVPAMDSAEWDEWLRASHQQISSGRHKQKLIGVPMISVNGSAALFGPVVGERTRGERAVRLWDAFRVLAAEDSFFELRRAVERPSLREYLGS
jgi:2-hydroxychromene-2-carboxylate isomerase